VAEVEVQNRRLEKRQVEAEKEFVKEKHGKEHAMFYADSFASGLIYTLVELEMETKALKRELEACTKANAELQMGQEATKARKGAAEGKLRLERQGREGVVLKPPCFFWLDLRHGLLLFDIQVRRLGWPRHVPPGSSSPARWTPSLPSLSRTARLWPRISGHI
jgi:hypothetical protein